MPDRGYNENARLAVEEADRGGRRPFLNPGPAAGAAALGAFVLLHWFSIATEVPSGKVLLPAILLASVVAAVIYFIVNALWNEWFRRYERAFDSLQSRSKETRNT